MITMEDLENPSDSETGPNIAGKAKINRERVKLEISETQIVKEETDNVYTELEPLNMEEYSNLETTTDVTTVDSNLETTAANVNECDSNFNYDVDTYDSYVEIENARNKDIENDFNADMEPIQVVEFEDSSSETETAGMTPDEYFSNLVMIAKSNLRVTTANANPFCSNLEMEEKSDSEKVNNIQAMPVEIVEIDDSSSDLEITETNVITNEIDKVVNKEADVGQVINIELLPMEIIDLDDSSSHSVMTIDEMDHSKSLNSPAGVQEGGGNYFCSLCRQGFPSTMILNLHLKVHLTDELSWCGPCERPFKQREFRERHMLLHTSVPNECTSCHTFFDTKLKLKVHKWLHSENKIASTYDRLIVHTASKNSKSSFRHLQVHKTDSNKCPACHKSFKFPSGLRVHMTKHMGAKALTCKICGISVVHKLNLNRHMQTHYAENKCPYCLQTFNTKRNLELHVGICYVRRKTKQYKTGITTKVKSISNHTKLSLVNVNDFNVEPTKDTESSKESMFTMINDDTSTKVKCRICTSAFATEGDLDIHMSMHGRDFTCRACNKKFNVRSNLHQHIQTHMQFPLRYQCKLCNKEYKNIWNHVGVHADSKKNVCDLCKEEFIRPRRSHKNVSDDGTPVCLICDLSFKDIPSLTLHKSSHAYRCVKCIKSVYEQVYSNVHIRGFKNFVSFNVDDS